MKEKTMKYETAIKVLEKQAKSSNIGIGALLANIKAVGHFGFSEKVCEAYKTYKTQSDLNNGLFY